MVNERGGIDGRGRLPKHGPSTTYTALPYYFRGSTHIERNPILLGKPEDCSLIPTRTFYSLTVFNSELAFSTMLLRMGIRNYAFANDAVIPCQPRQLVSGRW